jgi:hypothetical protein
MGRWKAVPTRDGSGDGGVYSLDPMPSGHATPDGRHVLILYGNKQVRITQQFWRTCTVITNGPSVREC